jgi:hypothetical protein
MILKSCILNSLSAIAVLVSIGAEASAGLIYSGPTETTHGIDPAIRSTDSRFQEWANLIDSNLTHFAPRGSTVINQSGGFNSLGDLSAAQIAAGESPGYLTVQFPHGIRNGAGHDFAVFENGFSFGTNSSGVPGLFAEFAYVDVSSNGVDFARFQSISLNTGPLTGSGAFAGFDVTQVYNLAGKHAAGFGTPFDLSELSTNSLVAGGQLDLDNIQYVRLFDIPGNGSYTDSQGNPIIDNWLTSGGGGFDFRVGPGVGVGVLNVAAVPEPSSFALMSLLFALGSVTFRRRHVDARNVLT